MTDQDELLEQREFLLRSIEDLDAERGAGDLAIADHEQLRGRYAAELAGVLRAIDEHRDGVGIDAADGHEVDGGAAARPPRRPRRRRGVAYAGTALVLAGVTLALVLTQLGARQPGATATGSSHVPVAVQVADLTAQAEAAEHRGDLAHALSFFGSVLQLQPRNVEALAESGWLEFEGGVVARDGQSVALGQSTEETAVAVGGSQPAPHLYLGEMLFLEHKPAVAVVQFREFLGDHPTLAQEAAAKSDLLKAFSQAHVPLPTLPAGSTSAP